MNQLENLHSPRELKRMSFPELNELCSQIRTVLIDTVSRNGGHLASNLGTVELTVALHRAFDSPNDKIVFDVGHQCYTHKLLTDRYERFSTLRTENGLSGFPAPDESEHDIFYSGHSSTSVSTTLGLATADRLDEKKSYSVAVIGDGSFTGGMVYEALNNGGKTKNRQIIILNDNHMSISESVGVLSKNLAVLRSRPEYFYLKAAAERTIKRIPFVGENIASALFRLKTDVKNRLYDQSNFFEQAGYRYMGPIDGHNLEQLSDALEGAKGINGPVVLHVITVKGKGYPHAEQAPSRFHGIGSFQIDSGETEEGKSTYSEQFGSFLCRAAEADDRLCAVTAAMALGTGLDEFSRRFPERFFDVGIAEQHAAAFCAGLAENGKLPVFAVYSTFFQRCYDQILHDAALQGLHIVFAVDRAGFVGEDGQTHQGLYDVAFLNSIPNLRVYSPCGFSQLSATLHKALYEEKGVTVVRYPRGGDAPLLPCENTDGEVYTYGNENAKTAVVSYGRVSSFAREAVCELSGDGEDIQFIGLNLVKPIPKEATERAENAQRVFFFEEGTESAGVGNVFALTLLKAGFRGEYHLTAVPDGFVKHASVGSLLKKYGLDREGIIKKVKGIE